MNEKIKKCKVCSADIAVKAKNCPVCGAKNKNSIYKNPVLYILIFFVLVIISGTSDYGKEKSLDYSNPNYRVSADEIMIEYSDNTLLVQMKNIKTN